jgi:hypothetical protein
LARIHIAVKKKDLKVIIIFKKELIHFLASLRDEGVLYRFIVHQKTIVLCLKKPKAISHSNQKQRV